MKIVVLDGHTLNPGDLNWDLLKELGDTVIYDRTSPAQTVSRIQNIDCVLTNKCPLGCAEILASERLRYIGVLATGFNTVDLETCRERSIAVTNIPHYGTLAVAQFTFSLILELANGVGKHNTSVHQGEWTNQPDFSYQLSPQVELDGLTLGIVGYGRIGRKVAEIGQAFGMKVIICTRNSTPAIENVSLDEMFSRSDIVSLHCPMTPETTHLVNQERLSQMKPSAFLINTSRGGLVDESALAEALNTGKIAGAGLDVLSQEPPPANNPLLTAKNTCLTPHMAWSTRAARQRLLNTAIQNIKGFQAGHPINRVS